MALKRIFKTLKLQCTLINDPLVQQACLQLNATHMYLQRNRMTAVSMCLAAKNQCAFGAAEWLKQIIKVVDVV